MKAFAVTSLLLLLAGFQLCRAETAADTSPVVAQVPGKAITANAIGLKYDAQHNPIIPIPKDEASCLLSDPVEELQAGITREIVRDYVNRKNLNATDEEIREFQVYQDNFLAQDRVRRQKDLAQLEERLKSATLNPKEREESEKYRATLLRLAEYDRRKDTMEKPTAEDLCSVYAPWVEAWKFNKSVYEQYGGTVAVTKFGPDPVEATRRLFEQYEKEGKLLISDAAVRGAFWSRLAKPPRFVAQPNEIDFTPYWKKPPSQNGN
jgi:hypothetical protein